MPLERELVLGQLQYEIRWSVTFPTSFSLSGFAQPVIHLLQDEKEAPLGFKPATFCTIV